MKKTESRIMSEYCSACYVYLHIWFVCVSMVPKPPTLW